MLDKVGLSGRIKHRPAEMSGGEQQRVAVARALINDPKLLLADEPTGNLDSKNAKQILEMLADLNSRNALTIIMVSHEENFVREFAHEFIRLQDGGMKRKARRRHHSPWRTSAGTSIARVMSSVPL